MCWKKFDSNYLRATRTKLLELDEKEKDLVIMGQVMATTGCGESTIANKKLERERLKNYTSFYHGGVKVYNTIAWHLKIPDRSVRILSCFFMVSQRRD